MSLCWGLNKEDTGRQPPPPPPCKENVGLRLRKHMHQILPVTVRKLQGVSAEKVHVTREPNYGVCCGEIDSQWSCFSLHAAVEPPFKIFITLLFKCTSSKGNLTYMFHSHQLCIYLKFNMLVVVWNPDVSRVFNIKNNFSKKKTITAHTHTHTHTHTHSKNFCWRVTISKMRGIGRRNRVVTRWTDGLEQGWTKSLQF
jgi:hypothetical protein